MVLQKNYLMDELDIKVILLQQVILVKWLAASSGKAAGTSVRESPMEVLKRRYAAGEIDRKEFEEKKKDLAH